MIKREHTGFWIIFFTFQIFGWSGWFIMGKENLFLMLNGERTAFADFVFYYSTMLGEWPLIIFVILFTGLYNLAKLHKVIIAFSVNGLLTLLFKQVLFKGTRRPLSYFEEGMVYTQTGIENSYFNSFPSGHTFTAFTGLFFLTLLIKEKTYMPHILGLLGFLAAYSRVYNGQHFVEDVLTGSIMGILVSYLIYTFVPDLKLKKVKLSA